MMASPLSEIRSLTSLRFFAAFWVVLYHYMQQLPDQPAVPVVKSGYLAVDFFFILSGFVLAHANYLKWTEKTFRYRDFLIKRIARIYPMHLATLSFFVLLVGGSVLMGRPPDNPERFNFYWLPAHLLLVNAWSPLEVGTFNHPSWSISAEWFAYLLFPVLICACFWRRVPAWLAILTAITLLIGFFELSLPLIGRSMTNLHSGLGIYRILPEFLLGLVVYRGARLYVLSHGAALSTFLLLCVPTFAFLGVDDIWIILTFAVLIWAAASGSLEGRRNILDARPLVYLGEVSYSIYMVHMCVAIFLFNALKATGHANIAFAVVGSLLVLPAAMFTYRFIEMPARRMALNRWQSSSSANTL
jgi:peptidoglycan/LPS O-acetylase OafA/YrhL